MKKFLFIYLLITCSFDLQAQNLSLSKVIYDKANRIKEVHRSNCTYTSYSYDNDGNRTIKNDYVVAVTATVVNTGCSASNGSISLTPVNGGSNYGYLWSNGAATASIINLGAGTYTVTITDLSNANGYKCSQTFIISQTTIITATVTAIGNTTFCSGDSVKLKANIGTGLTYQWNNNGTAIIGAADSVYYAKANGTYSVTVSNGAGCSATSTTISVTVGVIPTVTLSSNSPVCEGSSINFNSTGGGSYLWSGPNGFSSTVQNPVLNNTTAINFGTYTVTVTANGCTKSSTVNVISKPSPVITNIFISNVQCNGGNNGVISTTISGGVPPLTFNWSNGSSTQNISSLTAATYTLTVTGANTCTTSVSQIISQPSPVTATITPNGVTTFCNGGSVGLTANTGGGLSYQWKKDGNVISGATNSLFTATESGAYTVIVTNLNGCSATSNAIAVINGSPTTSITTNDTICFNGVLELHANVNLTGCTFSWTGPQTFSSTLQNPTITTPGTNATGLYTVTVTSPNGCTSTSTKNVTVQAISVGIWSGNVTCPGSSDGWAQLHWGGQYAPDSYVWSTGATTALISNLTAGTYTVTAKSNYGCEVIASVIITNANLAPTATFTSTGPTTYCANSNSLLLSASTGTNLSYQWLRDGNQVAVVDGGTNQLFYPNSSGSYKVVEITQYGCSDTSAALAVTVLPEPTATATAGGPITFCTGGSVVLSASTVGGIIYEWKRGSTVVDSGHTSYTATIAGNYKVKITAPNGCYKQSSPVITVTVNSKPTATITASGATSFCQGKSVVLLANTGTGYTYLWNTGAVTSSITVTTGGSYIVTVTNANGCTKSSTPKTVTVTQTINATITPSGATTFCQGKSVILQANTFSGYLWSTGATTQNIIVTTGGNYIVTVTNGSGCTASSSAMPVTVTQALTATITPTGNPTFCQGGSVLLTANFANSYLWTNGFTTQSITATTGGNYAVTIADGSGCTASATVAVTVNPFPTASITVTSGSLNLCNGDSVTLTASSGAGYTYKWKKNGSNISGATNMIYVATDSGVYKVTVTQNGCTKTSSNKTVSVQNCPKPKYIETFGVATNTFEEVNGVDAATSSGNILIGSTNVGGSTDIFMSNISSTGAINWFKTYGILGTDNGLKVRRLTADKSYVATGNVYSSAAGGADALLFKTDSSGNLKWAQRFGGNPADFGRGLVIATDNKLMMGGNTRSYGSGGSDFFLSKVDTGGLLQWTKMYGGSLDEDFRSLRRNANGGYIMCGNTSSQTAGGKDIYVVSTDSAGVVLWGKAYGGTGADFGFAAQDIKDSGFVIAGYTQSFNVGVADILLIKTKINGDTLWARTYGTPTNSETPNDLFRLSNGDYVICGKIKDAAGVTLSDLVLRINSSGTLLKAKSYSSGIDNYLNAMKQNNDGSFTFAGGKGDSLTRDILIVRTDSLLNSPSSCMTDITNIVTTSQTVTINTFCNTVVTTVAWAPVTLSQTTYSPAVTFLCSSSKVADATLKINNNDLSVFPNPTTGKTKLVFTLDKEQKIEVNLLNILGEQVDVLYSGNQAAGESELEFDVSRLSEGIYFVELVKRDGGVRRKLSVVK